MGFEDEVEQSLTRPCHEMNGEAQHPKSSNIHKSPADYPVSYVGLQGVKRKCCRRS